MGNTCAKNKARQSSTFFPNTVWFQSMGLRAECHLHTGESLTLGGSPVLTSSSRKPKCVTEVNSIVLERSSMQDRRERNAGDGEHLSWETDARESRWVNSHRAAEKLIEV